jgi:hypothetical protein
MTTVIGIVLLVVAATLALRVTTFILRVGLSLIGLLGLLFIVVPLLIARG